MLAEFTGYSQQRVSEILRKLETPEPKIESIPSLVEGILDSTQTKEIPPVAMSAMALELEQDLRELESDIPKAPEAKPVVPKPQVSLVSTFTKSVDQTISTYERKIQGVSGPDRQIVKQQLQRLSIFFKDQADQLGY